MTTLMGIDFAAEIAAAFGPSDLLPATLRHRTTGTRTPGQLSGGTNPTTTNYVTRGVVLEYSLHDLGVAPGVQSGDKKVMLIAKPLTDAGVEPRGDDSLTIEGKTYSVVAVRRDPATATYVCQCRGL